MSHPKTPRQTLRAALAAGGCIHPASVFDPPTMVFAESQGWPCAMLAGSVAAMAVLGAADLIVLTLSEFAEQARRLCRVSQLPLVVDADHGYGNALNAMRTVTELENAGVAALSLEDTLLPRPHGPARAAVLPLEEATGKLRAALAARRDPDLMIIGRSSAIGAEGMESALARIIAFEAAGADAVFLTGVKDAAQIAAARAAVKVPLMLGAVAPALRDTALLTSLGVQFCILGHHPYLAALEAAWQCLAAVKQDGPAAKLPPILPPERLALAERRGEYDAAIHDFMGG